MKIRTGFVSNSSSASFVVIWADDFKYIIGYRSDNKEEMIKNSILHLFNIDLHIEKDGSFSIDEPHSNKDIVRDAMEVIKNTSIDADGLYTTTFLTNMYNDINDFDPSMKSLLTQLIVFRSNFRLVHSHFEN